jgi:uncharacterized protein YcbX
MHNAGALTTMTTLKIVSRFSSPETHDFVVSDAAELASHMDHCASSRSRFFAVQTALDTAHSAFSARIVTVGVVVVVVVAALALA